MTTIVDAPARVDDLQLIGAMVGSGYRTPPALVRRGDGQTLQLTPLLYAVLDAVDGQRTCAEIAPVVSRSLRRAVSEDLVATLVDDHLRPLGLLKLADGTQPPVKRSNPLLALRLKLAITDPVTTRRLTDPFRILFRPVVAWAVVLGFLAVTWWVFFDQGLAPAAYDAFQRPQLLLLVFVVTVLSGGFHEFGHAAAARYSGAEPGVMGAGIYLVWPAFYTDVTDSYRLGRSGRIRTDLGGLYFNAVVVVLTFGSWYATQWDALLLLVATQTLQMVQQLMPMLRFDGYHLLADLTGVPDLYQRIRPTLVGLLPHRWSDPENRVLKPWARAVITAWVLVTIPMMAIMLVAMVTAVPRLLGTAWAVVSEDAAGVKAAWRTGGLIDITAHGLQVLAVVLPLMACFLILGRVGWRWSSGLAEWSRGSAPKRLVVVGLSAALVTGVSWAWIPQPGRYRPIEPSEKGLLSAVLPAAQGLVGKGSAMSGDARPAPGVFRAGASAAYRLASGAPLQATFPKGEPLPTRSDPQLAVVLVPSTGPGGAQAPASSATAEPTGTAGPTASAAPVSPVEPSDPASEAAPVEQGVPDQPTQTADPTGSTEPWVFPFDQPLPPAEGDNQAAAYNTSDDTVRYDVAFALVWATGDEVLNVNEAYAYASCSNCVTVAVAFQIVLIMDDAQVVVPQNLAVAVNYDCYSCITAALASQLVLSVQGAPDEEQLLALGEVWDQLTEFGHEITSYSLAEISQHLEEFKSQIVAILGDAPEVTTSAAPSPSASGTSAVSSDVASPAGSVDASPSGSSTTASSDSATTSSSGSTTSSPTGATDPSPSSAASPSESTTTVTADPTGETTSPTASPDPTPDATTSEPAPTP